MPIRLSDIPEAPVAPTAPTVKPHRLADIPTGAKPKPIRLSEIPTETKPKPMRLSDIPDKSFLQRMMSIGGKGLWKGLGIISWPFERIEYSIASPLVAATTHKPIMPAMVAGLKTWIPGKEVDEEQVKTFNDFWGNYYEAVTGEKAPESYKQIVGGATSFLVTPTILGQMLKGTGKVVKALPIAKKIRAGRIPAWQIAKLRTKAKVGARTERAGELGQTLGRKDLKQLARQLSTETGKPISPKAVQLRLTQLLKGGVTTKPKLAEITNPVIAEFQQNMKTLQKLGILGKETYITKLPKKRIAELLTKQKELQTQLGKLKVRKFPDRAKQMRGLQEKIDTITDRIQTSYKLGGTEYFPRMYTTKEEAQLAKRFPLYAGKRIRAQYTKARKDIPFEVRKAMGEIKRPDYPVMKRLIQEGSDIEIAKLFNIVKRKAGWTNPGAAAGFRQLPTEKAYGALKGIFVKDKIYNDVKELIRVRNRFEAFYDSIIGTWKSGKVLWNPATHFRNMFSNTVLLDLSGIDHIQQAKLLKQAIKEIRANSKNFQVAQRYFARTTLARGELLDDMLRGVKEAKGTGLERTINILPNFFKKKGLRQVPANIYQKEEFIGKFIKFLDERNKGRSVMRSVMEGNKWLFDYSELAGWERRIARRVMPFYTFPRKAIPRVYEAAATRPHTLAKYPLMAWALQKYSMAKLEMTEKDYAQVKKILPEYMKRNSYLLMPYRDNNGDLRFLDWTYLIPWGTLTEIQERGILDVFVSNPMVQVVSDIKRNKDSFFDRPIWKETDTEAEKFWKKVEHLWRIWVPSLAPKGLYWDKLYEAATGKRRAIIGKPKIRPLPETVAHTIFGLRTQPIDIAREKRFRIFEKREKVKELRSKLRKAITERNTDNITSEEFKKKKKQYLLQIKEVLQK